MSCGNRGFVHRDTEGTAPGPDTSSAEPIVPWQSPRQRPRHLRSASDRDWASVARCTNSPSKPTCSSRAGQTRGAGPRCRRAVQTRGADPRCRPPVQTQLRATSTPRQNASAGCRTGGRAGGQVTIAVGAARTGGPAGGRAGGRRPSAAARRHVGAGGPGNVDLDWPTVLRRVVQGPPVVPGPRGGDVEVQVSVGPGCKRSSIPSRLHSWRPRHLRASLPSASSTSCSPTGSGTPNSAGRKDDHGAAHRVALGAALRVASA